jgi:hypothetical protein
VGGRARKLVGGRKTFNIYIYIYSPNGVVEEGNISCPP